MQTTLQVIPELASRFRTVPEKFYETVHDESGGYALVGCPCGAGEMLVPYGRRGEETVECKRCGRFYLWSGSRLHAIVPDAPLTRAGTQPGGGPH